MPKPCKKRPAGDSKKKKPAAKKARAAAPAGGATKKGKQRATAPAGGSGAKKGKSGAVCAASWDGTPGHIGHKIVAVCKAVPGGAFWDELYMRVDAAAPEGVRNRYRELFEHVMRLGDKDLVETIHRSADFVFTAPYSDDSDDEEEEEEGDASAKAAAGGAASSGTTHMLIIRIKPTSDGIAYQYACSYNGEPLAETNSLAPRAGAASATFKVTIPVSDVAEEEGGGKVHIFICSCMTVFFTLLMMNIIL